MNLVNATKMSADFTMGTDKSGRDSIVVVVKGTFGIPERPDEEPQLLPEQVPLVMCDEFTGEPGFSAPLCEIDFAPFKPKCDVLLNGSAYAPGGKPAARITVSLRVGSVTKSLDVVGNRRFQSTLRMTTISNIEPFTVMPISYDNAYGGVDHTSDDPAKHRWYLTNHAGAGFYPTASAKVLDGKPLPNTEETGQAVSDPNGTYKPMAFGPIGRAWKQRVQWAGTYDQKWLDEKCPFLPDDFDSRYFQAAPEDQQAEYLQGGEDVELKNLTAEGRTSWSLPRRLELSVLFFLRTGEAVEIPALVDGLLIEPDHARFMLLWRAAYPVRRSVREVQQIIVGQTTGQWNAAEERKTRRTRKQRYPSLREMVRSARQWIHV